MEGFPIQTPAASALILTAIVINFATTAFLLVLASNVYSALGTENMDHLRGINDNE